MPKILLTFIWSYYKLIGLMVTNLTLFTKFEISSADTDSFGRIRLGSLINLLIQSAIKSADSLGFGFKSLSQQKMLWVLSRLSIEIYKPLQWYDVAEVETWPKNVERIFYIRDFIVRNQNNEIIAKATSAWLAIDLDSRRPKTLDKETTEQFTLLKDKHALDCSPEKLMKVEGDNTGTISPNFFDFDFNKHVTATRYTDWMMNTFPLEFHEKHYPKKLTVNYLKEILANEQIDIIKKDNDTESLFEGTNLNNDMVAFRGKIEF